MNQILIFVGASIYLMLGTLHATFTLIDVFKPRWFTPIDDSVREAMQGMPFKLNSQTDMWKGWLGFNLSHSLGLIMYGLFIYFITLLAYETLLTSIALKIGIMTISLIYILLSYKFWFWGPVLGTSLATLALGIGFLMA